MDHTKSTDLTRKFLRLLAPFAASLAVTAASAAVTWHDVQFGGFVSQGFLANTGNNDYLGETSEGTFDFREYAVNASWSKGQFRVGAQAFGQKLGEYGDDKISLDWATIDWQPAQWFGIRAGRVKAPRGLYNEALDVDSVRPFVLLPQSVYDARLRDFNASFDGGMIFGNIGISRAGSIDYKLFYGDVPMKIDSGANDYFNNDAPFPNTRIGMDSAVGGTVFWNTPINGLRFGASASVFKKFGMDRDVIFAPGFPPFTLYRATDNYWRKLLSVEYVTGDWTFAAEAGRDDAQYGVGVPGSAPIALLDFGTKYGYLSVARRLNDKFEAGAYYSYSKETQTTVGGGGLVFPDYIQHDFAVSLRYNVNDHWLVKLEVHQMDNAGKIFNTPTKPQPLATLDKSWTLLAIKTTYSF